MLESTESSLTLDEFRGHYDTQTGVFAVEALPLEQRESTRGLSDEGSTLRQTLDCAVISVMPTAPGGSVSLNTVAGSIGTTPDVCIPANELSAWARIFYAQGGAFCDCQIDQGNARGSCKVAAEITSITPGYEAFEYVPTLHRSAAEMARTLRVSTLLHTRVLEEAPLVYEPIVTVVRRWF